MSIYTKRGDSGETDLLNGVRTAKDDIAVSVIGTLDELNSLLGVVRSECALTDVSESLAYLQRNLFTLGAYFAGKKDIEIPRARVLEVAIDDLESFLPKLHCFVLPSGHKVASLLHHARSMCRRAERMIAAYHKKDKVSPDVLMYVNRMSDFLFTLARYVNHFYMIQETPWEDASSQSTSASNNAEVSIPPVEVYYS